MSDGSIASGVISLSIATIAALSVATERVIELLKQLIGGFVPGNWLFTPLPGKPIRENWRCAAIHMFSGVIAGVVAYHANLTKVYPDNKSLNALLYGSSCFSGLRILESCLRYYEGIASEAGTIGNLGRRDERCTGGSKSQCYRFGR